MTFTTLLLTTESDVVFLVVCFKISVIILVPATNCELSTAITQKIRQQQDKVSSSTEMNYLRRQSVEKIESISVGRLTQPSYWRIANALCWSSKSDKMRFEPFGNHAVRNRSETHEVLSYHRRNFPSIRWRK